MEYLSDVPFVAPPPGTDMRAAHDSFFRNYIKVPRVVAECSDPSMLMELVRGGLGTAISSRSRVAALDPGDLAVRALSPASALSSPPSADRRHPPQPTPSAKCWPAFHVDAANAAVQEWQRLLQ